MRHLDQILSDKKDNDLALAKATKRDGELKTELAQLYAAVKAAVDK